MPVTKSAKGALKQSKRRRGENLHVGKKLKSAIKAFRATPTALKLAAAYSSIDRAAKVHVIHKNKAARLKGNLATLVKPTSVSKNKKKTVKKSKSPRTKK